MLSRSCQNVKGIGKRCLGLVNPPTSKLLFSKQYPVIVSAIRLSSTSESSASVSDFTNVIDSLFAGGEANNHFAEKLKNVTSLNVLEAVSIVLFENTVLFFTFIVLRRFKTINSIRSVVNSSTTC